MTTAEQRQVFEAFNRYPWEADKAFQAGLASILSKLPPNDQEEGQHDDKDLLEEAKLMKAKHFYFTRFQQNFDLEAYLKYEQEKLEEKKNEQDEALFQRVEDYDYENDVDYTNGLPNIIHGWLEQQSKSGLWDKERLELEFSKAKAFYYVARVEKVDLVAYFKWKAKKEEANKPSCPFANLWQNKAKIGPIDQTNAFSFVVTEKAKGTGAETITLSSPKSQNIFSVDRLNDLSSAIKDGQNDTHVTSLFITATVADSSNPFEINEHIETKDTKIISSGLAYNETSTLVSGSELRQVSVEKLADAYYNLINSIIGQEDKKLVVTFSNGQIPLNTSYLTLCLGFMRVITEHTLLHFKLELSHAPIPPLLLLVMARARTNATKKPLPAGMELYLALAAPEYSKLRGPEILRLGLADAFVPEVKLSDAFETAKKMAVCPAPDTSSSVQLALAIHHTYAGPNRLQVWEEQIEKIFGPAESFDDLKSRLKQENNIWSKTILNHWNALPPTLLQVIFKAVKQSATVAPLDILALEKKLNSKWRQTEDYKEWLRSKNNWTDDDVDFYFEDLELPTANDEAVVYEAPQETEEGNSVPMVCPVTGQKPSATAVCSVGRDKMALAAAGVDSNVCPVSGQRGDGVDMSNAAATNGKCPYINDNAAQQAKSTQAAVCPVSGQKSEGDAGKCPYRNGQQTTLDVSVRPVSESKSAGDSLSTAQKDKCPYLSSQKSTNTAPAATEALPLEPK